MLVKIRLTRKGARNAPFYRVVVADSRSPRDGRFIESLGYYDPTVSPRVVRLNEERARHWLDLGAEPSGTVKSLLRQQGILSQGVDAGEMDEADAEAEE
ncbi:MAG: 30S ribosomal protein S16 [Candidatus Latescibacteria bacterium]|nr:30S ribosomal protein S16 [Candidatus Latescibacterota bacterium]